MSAPEERRLRCTVTTYHVDAGALVETATETTTGTHVRDGWLYLHNSSASAPAENLLNDAREGRGWMAQYGAPPVFVNGRWGGRNWPKIEVSAEALLEVLEEERWQT